MRKWAINPDSRQWLGPVGFGVLLALLLAAAFPGIVAGTSTFFLRDYGVLGYPFIHFAHESFWRGELPMWNPLSNCGAPFMAQWGTMVFYPFSLFYLLLPLPWSLGVFCLAHLWLGGQGMRALAERWTGHRLAAAVAGMAFVFNGATLSCLAWPNYTVALGWMPWLVLWMEKSWREGGRNTLWAIAAATCQMLVGVPEVVALTWIIVAALACVEIGTRANSLRVVLSRIFYTVLATSGLAAIQLLPFFELASHSQRGSTFATAKWAMPAWGWGNFLVPLQHNYMNFQRQFFHNGQEFLSSYYLGAGMVVLAVVAVFMVRQARTWVLAGLTLWVLLMALGDNGFLYPLLRKTLPLLGLARYPIKFVLLTVFTVPLLAAFILPQLETAASASKNRVWRSTLLCALLALGAMAGIVWWAGIHPLPFDQTAACRANTVVRAVCLVWFIGALALWSFARKPILRTMGQGLLAAALLTDIFTHTTWQNPVLDSSVMSPGLVGPEKAPRWGEGRVMIVPAAEDALLRSKIRDYKTDFIGKRLALWSNLNVLEDVPKLNGSSTLQIGEEAEIQKLFYRTNAIPLPHLADFLSVSRQTSSNSVVEWVSRDTFMPLITMGQAPEFLDRTNTLRALQEPDFNSRRVVYLPVEAQSSLHAISSTNAHVESAKFGNQRIEADTTSDGTALMVIAQSFYPAWKAEVDGQETPLWRANYAFQALEVPAGKHHVVLAYRDRPFYLGACVSGISLLGCFLVGFRTQKPAEV